MVSRDSLIRLAKLQARDKAVRAGEKKYSYEAKDEEGFPYEKVVTPRPLSQGERSWLDRSLAKLEAQKRVQAEIGVLSKLNRRVPIKVPKSDIVRRDDKNLDGTERDPWQKVPIKESMTDEERKVYKIVRSGRTTVHRPNEEGIVESAKPIFIESSVSEHVPELPGSRTLVFTPQISSADITRRGKKKVPNASVGGFFPGPQDKGIPVIIHGGETVLTKKVSDTIPNTPPIPTAVQRNIIRLKNKIVSVAAKAGGNFMLKKSKLSKKSFKLMNPENEEPWPVKVVEPVKERVNAVKFLETLPGIPAVKALEKKFIDGDANRKDKLELSHLIRLAKKVEQQKIENTIVESSESSPDTLIQAGTAGRNFRKLVTKPMTWDQMHARDEQRARDLADAEQTGQDNLRYLNSFEGTSELLNVPAIEVDSVAKTERRNQIAQEFYGKDFDDLTPEQKDEVTSATLRGWKKIEKLGKGGRTWIDLQLGRNWNSLTPTQKQMRIDSASRSLDAQGRTFDKSRRLSLESKRLMDNYDYSRWLERQGVRTLFKKGGRAKQLTNKHVKGRGTGWHEERLNHSKASVKGKMKKWRK